MTRTRAESDVIILKAITNNWLTTSHLDLVASVFDGLCDSFVNRQTVTALQELVMANNDALDAMNNDD